MYRYTYLFHFVGLLVDKLLLLVLYSGQLLVNVLFLQLQALLPPGLGVGEFLSDVPGS